MAMRIFNANETIFTSNGLKSLQPIYCHEIRNESEWHLDIRVPLSFLEYTTQDNIIVVETLDKGEQAFRIRNITVGQDIKFEAWHIGYDSRVFTVALSTFVNLNPTQALTQLLTDTQTNNFTVFSDIATQLSFSIIDVPLYDALIDMAERYNAVLEFDNWQIRLVSSIGSDKGVTVAYGKNLESSSFEENWDMVVTELYPKGNNGLVGATLYSSIVYDRPYAKIVSFDTDDLTTLNNLASAYLSRFEKPRVNYKVKASNLSYLENVTGHNALSYFSHLFLENYSHNELSDFKYPTLVGLGDTIKVVAKQFELFTDVLSYKFNTITRKMIELEFGNYRPTIRNAIGQLRAEITEQADRKAQIKIDEVNGEIDLRVKKDEVIASINLSPETIKILAPNIALEGIITANGNVKIDALGNIEVLNGIFNGNITAQTGSIGRFDISGDDLVYTSELFEKDYDNSDRVKLHRILLGFEPQTAYDLAVYDVNNSGTLNITDLVLIDAFVQGIGSLPTPRRRIRSVVRIGTNNGALTTQAVAENGAVGPTTTIRGEKINTDLVNTKALSTNSFSLNGETVVGVVVESGNNSNGRYMRFSDGTMIAWGEATTNTTSTSALENGGFRTGSIIFNFPATFFNVPLIVANNRELTRDVDVFSSGLSGGAQFSLVWKTISSDATTRQHRANWIAIGRWKA